MKSKIGFSLQWLFIILFLIFFSLLQHHLAASAKSSTDFPTISFQEVVSGLSSPVHLTNAGDGSGRLFIVEQAGMILIYKNSLLSQPFLDISDRVRSPASGGGNEEGLLSVVFPPGFGSTVNHFYVYYTNKNGDNQVSRYDMSADPNLADANSEKMVIYINHPTYSNHNGGQLAFGPDDYLYIGTGDGGGGGDPNNNAQNPDSLLGKILRIDVELQQSLEFTPKVKIYFPLAAQGNPANEQIGYRIPETNPFANVAGYRPEIWALGLRNPWRFSFDLQTGDLWIGDVGQNEREEVDFQPANSPGGENYGWNIMEGSVCYSSLSCNQSGLVLPIHEYSHIDNYCSITGGFVYRGASIPSLQGVYLFGDFCSGRVWGMQSNGSSWDVQELTQLGLGISSFGEDEGGELYLVFRGQSDKIVYKIIQAIH
jgi:glucose/arabinose dehydrogenase